MRFFLPTLAVVLIGLPASAATPFETHGRIRVSKSGTHLEHADGTPFFVLADTCWSGPALSTEAEWAEYLADRKAKGFTAIQFNMASPWRCTPTDADGQTSYTLKDGQIVPNEAYYRRVDARLKAINDAGLLAVPVLCWAHTKGDAGKELTEAQIVQMVKFEVDRYGKTAHVLWLLAGDNNYKGDEAAMWKRIGRAVFGDAHPNPVCTHPTGRNWPWKDWESEKWLTVLGYQSGHGDDPNTWKWLHSGPPAEYGKRATFTRPVLNLEPPYEGHNGYASKKPHSDFSTRRAIYWSLLVHPIAGVTYGGHGVWSWHQKAGDEPIAHKGTGPAKPWRESLNLPGATQAGIARKIFETLPWTELRLAPEMIEQPEEYDPTTFRACAATPDRSTVVVYMPTGLPIGFHKPFAKAVKLTWYDVRTGNPIPNTEEFRPRDGTKDMLLVVRQ